MARVSLIEPDQHPELEPILAKIRSGRRGTVINVYKLLLHTPGIAEIWLDLINAVRWKVELDGRLREVSYADVAHAAVEVEFAPPPAKEIAVLDPDAVHDAADDSVEDPE